MTVMELEYPILKAAFDCLTPGAYPMDYTEEFIEALIDEIMELEPFCDHSVGICACFELETISQLRLALNGREVCPGCGGEGFQYRETHIAECDRVREEGWDCDLVHMRDCWVCGGRRWVYRKATLTWWQREVDLCS